MPYVQTCLLAKKEDRQVKTPNATHVFLFHPHDHLPLKRTGFSDRACEASSLPSADDGVPASFGAKCADEDLHVGAKLSFSRLKVHLVCGRETAPSLDNIVF